MGAAMAVKPSRRLVRGTGGSGAAAAGGASAEAADCNASGTAECAAAKFWTMSRQGTPGLAAGSALAVALTTRTGHNSPMVAKAVKTSPFVLRDTGGFPDFVDGTATDRSFPVLLNLLK